MSITDELRKWARGFENVWFKPASKEIVVTTGTSMPVDHVNMRLFIEGMLDRVDAEHEREVTMARGEAVTELGHKVVSEYVKLPTDADGEYIRVGDTLDGYGKTIEVVEMRYGRGGWVLISGDGSGYADTFAFAHHHAPTVEDVLREFTDEVWNRCCEGATASDSGIDELVAEYSAKLRLAGENA